MSRLAAWVNALAEGSIVLLVAGCVVAVGAAAAGGGIYYSKRGAEMTIAVPIQRVFLAGQRALAEEGIRRTEAELEHEDGEDEGKGRIEGKRGDLKLKVTLRAEHAALTRVRVVAKRENVGWDKDYARAVLERIAALAH